MSHSTDYQYSPDLSTSARLPPRVRVKRPGDITFASLLPVRPEAASHPAGKLCRVCGINRCGARWHAFSRGLAAAQKAQEAQAALSTDDPRCLRRVETSRRRASRTTLPCLSTRKPGIAICLAAVMTAPPDERCRCALGTVCEDQ